MSDATKDPAIKLFGRTIARPDDQTAVATLENSDLAPMNDTDEVGKATCGEAVRKEVKDQAQENMEGRENNKADVISDSNDSHTVDNQSSNLDDKPTTFSKAEHPGQEPGEANTSTQEKVLKKPDKILPCPRCNSMDTKFCYYNNYNVNQPRHFCKNCQRYWTAGGTMRNVPVGAGRRKSKHSASHCRRLLVSSDGMSSPQVENADFSHSQFIPCGHSAASTPIAGNRTVLKFSQEAPLREAKDKDLTFADQKRKAEPSLVIHDNNVKELSCVSTTTTDSKSTENENFEMAVQLDHTIVQAPFNGLTPVNLQQCYPGPPWAYPWGPGWNNIAAIASGQCTSDVVYSQENCAPKLIPWSSPPLMTTPPFVAPPMPYPFIPPSFWGCVATWPSGTWKVPWSGANGNLSPSSSVSNSVSSSNHSPTLGKHSRDANSQVAEKTKKSLWIPKTLRIDDPDEAAKSSIWATLGIKPDRDEPITKGGIFKSFQPRTEDGDNKSDTAEVLRANPAALSRSNTFQEST